MPHNPEEKPTYLQDVILPERRKRGVDEASDFEFSPEQSITPKDFERILNTLKELRRKDDWIEFVPIASSLQVLFPEHREKLGIDQETIEWAFKNWHEDVSDKDPDLSSTDHIWSTKELLLLHRLSEHRDKAFVDEDALRDKLAHIFDQYRNTDWFSLYFGQCAIALCLLRQNTRQELGLNEEAWRVQFAALQESRNSEAWHNFASAAADLKMLFQKQNHELGVDKNAWEGISNTLKQVRDASGLDSGGSYPDVEELVSFLNLSVAMKILATHKVTVDENGIHFEEAKPTFTKEPIPPMPEERKF